MTGMPYMKASSLCIIAECTTLLQPPMSIESCTHVSKRFYSMKIPPSHLPHLAPRPSPSMVLNDVSQLGERKGGLIILGQLLFS